MKNEHRFTIHLDSLSTNADRRTQSQTQNWERRSEKERPKREKKKNADIVDDGDGDDSKSMDETKVLKISLELSSFRCYSIHFGLECNRGAVANVFIIRQNRQTRSHLGAHISIELPIVGRRREKKMIYGNFILFDFQNEQKK